MLPKTAKDTKESQSRLDFFLMKSEFHKLIAFFVFSVDVDKEVQDDFAVNGGNYMKSIDNYLGRYIFVLYLLVHTHQPSLGCEMIIQ